MHNYQKNDTVKRSYVVLEILNLNQKLGSYGDFSEDQSESKLDFSIVRKGYITIVTLIDVHVTMHVLLSLLAEYETGFFTRSVAVV